MPTDGLPLGCCLIACGLGGGELKRGLRDRLPVGLVIRAGGKVTVPQAREELGVGNMDGALTLGVGGGELLPTG
ncbi:MULTISPECIES: hypothetical protein [unclassified Streptomyces]|uniref:hypothetical protein n=1 Tax=unclassified Streptomyces TaxID=2593676 RepID=UPI002E7FFAA7|nr:hypothetical protein [Streptomyces sp. NBC_00589]WUB23910.1 hypothetical protein OHA51_00020 [Streptomyces sp. NBC_00589]